MVFSPFMSLEIEQKIERVLDHGVESHQLYCRKGRLAVVGNFLTWIRFITTSITRHSGVAHSQFPGRDAGMDLVALGTIAAMRIGIANFFCDRRRVVHPLP